MNKKFRIGDLFRGYNGNTDIKKEHINGKGYPVVSSGLENTGIIGFSDIEARIFPSNTITIDMFGNVFFRDFEYKIVTHARVFSLVLKDHQLTLKAGLYIASILSWLSKVFSYNNMCSYNKIAHMNISLPVIEHADSNHEYTVDDIDWQYMEDRIRELEEDRIRELDAYLKATNLDDYELTDEDKKVLSLSRKSTSNENGSLETDCQNGQVRFKEFLLGDLFSSSTGDVDLQQKDINGKGVFFINSGVDNHGIKGKTDRKAKIFPANTITIDFWGNAYYRDFEYKMATHNHVFSLTGKIIKNRLVGLYLIGRLAKLPTLFSYNNMATWNKLRMLTITLPVTSDSEPDFDYMERYIRAIEKLTIADVVKYKDKVIDTTKILVNSQS